MGFKENEANTERRNKAYGTYDVELGDVPGLLGLEFELGQDGSVEIGSPSKGWTRLSELNILPQIRTEFSVDDLQELAQSLIIEDIGGTPRVTLIHDLSVIVQRTPELAAQYLEDHAAYYEIPEDERLSVDDLIPNSEGHFEILGMGNRRTISLRQLLTSRGVPLEQARVQAAHYVDAPFHYMQRLQRNENTHTRPNYADQARDMRFFRNQFFRDYGRYPSRTAIAEVFGVTEHRVRQAIRFEELPERIKNYAYTGLAGKTLEYGTVLKLGDLYDAYVAYNGGDQAAALRDVETFCNSELSTKLRTGDTMKIPNRLIDNKIDEIRGQAVYQQAGLALFDMPEASPKGRSSVARRRLVNEIARNLDLLIRNDALRPAEIAQLQHILAQGSLAATNVVRPVDDESDESIVPQTIFLKRESA